MIFDTCEQRKLFHWGDEKSSNELNKNDDLEEVVWIKDDNVGETKYNPYFVRMLQIVSTIFVSLDAQLEFAKFAYK